MSLFSVNGTVTAIGQSLFNNELAIYAFIEITEALGPTRERRESRSLQRRGLAAPAWKLRRVFFDKMYVCGGRFRCQL